jgi:hypothetical protein
MKSFLALLTLLLSTYCFAQSEEENIKQTINRLFNGMRQSDTAMIRSAFTSEAVLQTVIKNREGRVVIETEPLDSFIVFVSKPHNEIYDERIKFDLIKVDDDLAIAWTPYKFYLGEKFSHCGVDSYQLVRMNGEWKIQYLIDTRRRQHCE